MSVCSYRRDGAGRFGVSMPSFADTLWWTLSVRVDEHWFTGAYWMYRQEPVMPVAADAIAVAISPPLLSKPVGAESA